MELNEEYISIVFINNGEDYDLFEIPKSEINEIDLEKWKIYNSVFDPLICHEFFPKNSKSIYEIYKVKKSNFEKNTQLLIFYSFE